MLATVHLAVEQPGAGPGRQGVETVPSLALATALQVRRPGVTASFALDQNRGDWVAPSIRIRPHAIRPLSTTNAYESASHVNRMAEPTGEVWSVEVDAITPRTEDSPVTGLRAGARVAEAVVVLPDDAAFDAARLPYEAVFAMSPAELRQRIGGRVLLVTDLRAGKEPRYDVGGGREVPGSYIKAAALGAALRGGWVRVWRWPGMLALAGVACAAAAALVIMLNKFAPGRRTRMVLLPGVAFGVAGGLFLLSVGLFRFAGELVNPFPPSLGAALAGVTAAAGCEWAARVDCGK
jgi:hypothetical protein